MYTADNLFSFSNQIPKEQFPRYQQAATELPQYRVKVSAKAGEKYELLMSTGEPWNPPVICTVKPDYVLVTVNFPKGESLIPFFDAVQRRPNLNTSA